MSHLPTRRAAPSAPRAPLSPIVFPALPALLVALAVLSAVAGATHLDVTDTGCAVFPFQSSVGQRPPLTAATFEGRVRLSGHFPLSARTIVAARMAAGNSTFADLSPSFALRLTDDTNVHGRLTVQLFFYDLSYRSVIDTLVGETMHLAVTVEKLPPTALSVVVFVDGVARTRGVLDYAETGAPDLGLYEEPWGVSVGCSSIGSQHLESTKGHYLNGELDQVRIWGAVRSPAEIREAAAHTYASGELLASSLLLAFHANASGITHAYNGTGQVVMVAPRDGDAVVVGDAPLVVDGLDPLPAEHVLRPYQTPDQDASTFPWSFDNPRGFQEAIPFGDHGFLFFGGCLLHDGNAPIGGPFLYDYATGTMAPLETTGTPPDPRCMVSMNVISRQLIITGGLVDMFDISLPFYDTIDVLDLDTMAWSQPWTLPRPRALHQGFEVDGRIWLVLGGAGLFVGEADIFVLDPTDGTVDILATTGENPEKMSTANAMSGRSIYSFGGVEHLLSFPAGDMLYRLDIDTREWTALAAWTYRAMYATMAIHGSRVLVWGGVESDIEDFNELLTNPGINLDEAFEYDLDTGEVTLLENPDFFYASISAASFVVGSQLVMTYDTLEADVLVRTTQLDECPETCTLNRGVCYGGLCECHPPFFDNGDYSCSLQPCTEDCGSGYCDETTGVCVDDLEEDPRADFVQVAIVAGTLFGVCGAAYYGLQRANPGANNFVVVTVILSLADIVTDILFTVDVWDNPKFRLEAQLALVFLILPFVFDVVAIALFISQRLKIDGRKYFVENEAIVASVCLLATTNVAALNLLCSKIAHKPAFSLDWDRQLRHRIRMVGLLRMLAEDMPHLTLQIIVATQLDNVSTLLYLSFFFTSSGLLISFIRLGMYLVLQCRKSRVSRLTGTGTVSELDVVSNASDLPAAIVKRDMRINELERQVESLQDELAQARAQLTRSSHGEQPLTTAPLGDRVDA